MKSSTILMSLDHERPRSLNTISIKKLTDLYAILKETEEHRNLMVWAMSEVKASIDHWGEETKALDSDEMIKHDINRLQEVIDWCIEETKKIRKK